LTYAGGLHHLKEIQTLTTPDLEKLKADLPKVKITSPRMTAEHHTQWDGFKAKKK